MDLDEPSEPTGSRSGLGDVALAVLVVTGYGAPLLGLLVAGLGALMRPQVATLLLFMIGFVAWIGLMIRARQRIRRRGRRPFLVAAYGLVIAPLPAWGMAYSHTAKTECAVSSCEGSMTVFRPLAEPEVYVLLALQGLTAFAYLLSRHRPAALHPPRSSSSTRRFSSASRSRRPRRGRGAAA